MKKKGSRKEKERSTISGRQVRFIRFLVSKTKNRVDGLSETIGHDLRNDLSHLDPKKANYVITMLKQEMSWLESQWQIELTPKQRLLRPQKETPQKPNILSGSSYSIEMPSGEKMTADNTGKLLSWGVKRFRGHPDQLRKLKDFLSDSSGKFVTIAGYIIRRAV